MPTRAITVAVKAIREPVTEKDLVDAIVRYFHTTHIPYLQYLSRLDDKGYAQAYGKGVPCRRYGGESNPMVYSRPSESSQRSRSVAAREMIVGNIEEEIFDFDAICSMTEADVANMERQAKVVHDELNKNRLIR